MELDKQVPRVPGRYPYLYIIMYLLTVRTNTLRNKTLLLLLLLNVMGPTSS